MSSDAAPDQHATPEQHVQRAQLLADLGRYDDAAIELGFAIALDPHRGEAYTLLARVHLAAGRPADALAATDAAIATTGVDTAALGARAMALVDLRRFGEAADVAHEILRLGSADAEAQCLGAAILAEARNGQPALDAAWRAVQLAPDQAQTHLVLGLVAARLELFQLAERAYREALELDPELADARHDIGVIKLEQRRYAEALEHLAEAAVMRPANPAAGRAVGNGLRRVLHLGAGYSFIAPALVACLALNGGAGSRLFALLVGAAGLIVLGVFASRLPGKVTAALRPLMRSDRALAVAVVAVVAGPCLVLLYALVGTPWPLALAVGAGAVALLANVLADFRVRP
ncbi:MAG TPA: tetratricopeptide repeat protein [Pilimelia sp.]|nr:tetratricopeptide repeat protein [Pilimelia sp.]